MLVQLCLSLLTTSILHDDFVLAKEVRMETISTASYFNLSRVSPNQLQFTWKAQSLTKLNVSLVKVTAKPSSSSGTDRYATAWASSGIVTVEALEPYTLYNVTVEAIGERIQFMQLMGLIRTWPTAPSPVAAPTGSGISNTKIKLKWSKPIQANGILEPYRATCYSLMRAGDSISVSTGDNKTTSVIVDKLNRNTKYKCVVEASTAPAYGQHSKDCTRMSSSSYPIQTLDVAMLKPTFEATCYEENEELDLLIHKPEDVEGEFGGFEVLLRIGSPIMQNPWYSEVNLTAGEREYKVKGLIPSIPYSVTVRGLVLPDTYSDKADPLTFQILNANHSLPQNVKLEAVDSRTVNMTWDQPAELGGLITGYTIKWSVDNGEQQEIHLSPCQFHVFTELEPQVTVSAAIRTHYQPSVPMKFEYVGSFCGLVTAFTLPAKRGGRIGRSPRKHPSDSTAVSIMEYTPVPPMTMTETPTFTHTFAMSADTEPTSAPAATTDGSKLGPAITMTGHSPSSPPIITIMEHTSTPLLIPSTISASTPTITEMEISDMVSETATTSEPISTPSFIMESLSESSPPIAIASEFTSDSVISTDEETPSTTKSTTNRGPTSVCTVTASKPTSNPVVATTKGFTLPPETTKSKRFESSPAISSSEVPASTLAITASKRPISTSSITTTASSKPRLSIAMTERSVQTSVTTTSKRLSSTPKITSTREPALEPLGTTGGSTLIPVQNATRVFASTPAIKKSKRRTRSPAMTKGKAPASSLATSAIESSTSTFVITTTRAPAMPSSITINEESPSTPPKTTNKMNLSTSAVTTAKASAQIRITTNIEDSHRTFITASGFALTFAISAIVLTCMAVVLV